MNDRISYVCALSMIAVGCATEAQVTCEVFVDAWADYDVRCPGRDYLRDYPDGPDAEAMRAHASSATPEE